MPGRASQQRRRLWATRQVTPTGWSTPSPSTTSPRSCSPPAPHSAQSQRPGRIVTVSSGVQATGTINFGDLQGERRYSGQQAYSQSKLANVLFTYELSRRLDGTCVTANVLDSGVVRTGFAAEDPRRHGSIPPPHPAIPETPQKGAATSIYLASAPEVQDITGAYFANREPKTSSPSSYNTAAAARLSQTSLNLLAPPPNGAKIQIPPH